MSHVSTDLSPGTDSSPNPSPDSSPAAIAEPKAKVKSKKAHPTFHFVAGLGSGVTSAVLLQPIDLLKTRVQQSRSSSLLPVLRSILSGPSPVYNLWRGTVPSALRTGFGSALYFTTLSTLRQLVANNTARVHAGGSAVQKDGVLRIGSSSVLPKLSSTGNMVTGATARVLAGLVLMPVTVIKVRYESDYYAYKSLSAATTSIYKSEGFRGFFTGFGATAVRDAPYAGLYVVFYERSKAYLNQFFASADQTYAGPTAGTAATINATSGVIAAGVATCVTNPFDAVKTRLQLMPRKYQNMVQAVRVMLLEDGVKSLFDGLALRMGRKAVSSALVWTVYEELIGRTEKKFFDESKSVATI